MANSQVKGSMSRGFCRGINGCVVKSSIVSASQYHHPASRLEMQVGELEREVQKQKEVQSMYKKRMERTQDYLRHCLQVAQDNGFLHLILGGDNNAQSHDQQSHDPLLQSPVHNSDMITSLILQAKLNGWFIQPHEIELQEKIGQGSTSNIYKATWRGLDVAVKCINPDFFNSNENGVTFFAQELETLSKQRHRFVLRLMGACLDPPNHGWIVTELLSTTLKEWLHGSGNRKKERPVPLPPLQERLTKALEISQAMQYLHEQNPKVIHRDLKPSNIFLDDSMHVRVADFGHARFLHDSEMAITGETGTYVYMAPEVIRCEPYNERSDVYSFSVILNELITGEHPYIDTDYGPAQIAMEVGEGKLRPTLPEDDGGVLGELIPLVSLSWHENASIRPAFSTVTSSLRSILKRLLD